MPDELYFEDLQPGMKIRSIRSYEVTAEEIKEFAAKYDPQPFHLDEAAAEKTFFKGLAASGWMTAAITMRLRVESMHVAGGMIGAGVDEIFRLGMAHPMGPLTLADFIGLDVCLDIMRVLEEGMGDPKYRPCPLLIRMVDAGWLGRKSGRGFYEYKK